MHACARWGRLLLLRLLQDEFEDNIEVLTPNGRTPLHVAAAFGQVRYDMLMAVVVGQLTPWPGASVSSRLVVWGYTAACVLMIRVVVGQLKAANMPSRVWMSFLLCLYFTLALSALALLVSTVHGSVLAIHWLQLQSAPVLCSLR